MSRGGSVEIIGDDLRASHPLYDDLMVADDQSAAFYTDRDSGRWVEKAIAYAKEQRFNVVIEGTFRSSDVVANTMRQFRAAGYEIDARALAVNERLSLQGIIERYEAQRAARGNGRMTLPSSHRAAYDGMVLTLDRIEREVLADRLSLYRRGNEVIYSNRAHGGAWQEPARACEALQAERARPWSSLEFEAFHRAADRIDAFLRAPGRNASQAELSAAAQLHASVDPLSRYPEVLAARERALQRQGERSIKGPSEGGLGRA